MERKTVFSVDEYYHIYDRGVDKRIIFIDDYDRDRFVKLLFVSNGTRSFVYRDIQNRPLSEIDTGPRLVVIGAYCLMPNHFHFLVREIVDGGISKFMGKLLTSYSSYFNKRHGRTGRLFEGTFKAEHVFYDGYLKYLFSYIHLNPIKLIQKDWKEKGIRNKSAAVKYLNNYQYSSYIEYSTGSVDGSLILSKNAFPEYFTDIADMETEVVEWLDTWGVNT